MKRNTIPRKGFIIGIILLLIGASAVVSSAGNNDSITTDTVELTFTPAEYEFTLVQTTQSDFTLLSLPEEGFTTTVGEAKLPVIRRFIEIPHGASPEIIVTSVSWDSTSLVERGLPDRIIPVQPSVPKIPGALEAAEFILDHEYYSANGFVPHDVARVAEIGEIRGHRVALVEVFPVQYNPACGELRLMTHCDLTIHLPGSDVARTAELHNRYASPSFDTLLGTLLENYQQFGIVDFSKTAEGYLIIVYTSFLNDIQPLVTLKENMGYDVTVTTTSQIPGGVSTTTIKAYIADAYENWEIPPSYVLLVGDTPQIPTYTGTTGWPGPADAVDLYYVTMTTPDYLPDIFIGRFPASSASHVTAMVDKTVYYEQGNFASTAWIKKAAFMASTDNWQVSEGTHNYVINTFLLPNGYTCDKLYTHTYGATTQQVRNALNDGRSLAIFSGHGYEYGWADGPPFSQSDVNGLTNQDMYPFVCSHSCSTGTFSVSECFGETWVRRANKGGLAFWGASDSTLWDEDDILERKMFSAWWTFDQLAIGAMTDKALYDLWRYYAGGGYTKYYYEAYNVLGDPSVKIWRDEPEPVLCGDCNGDEEVDVGDVVYLVNYLYNGGSSPIQNLCVGDCNNDGIVNIGDVVFLINFLYRGGSVPSGCCEN
jgi:hypothetical protein